MKNLLATASIIISAFSMQACELMQSPEFESLSMLVGGSTTTSTTTDTSTSTSTDSSTDVITVNDCYECM